MHILITGAAGMIGRKLVARLVDDGALNGRAIEKLTLIDIATPQKPDKFSGKVETSATDIADPAAARASVAGKPDVIFHLAAVVSGEAEARFREGRPRQSRRLARAPRSDPHGRRRLSPARGLHLVDRGVRRAVPGRRSPTIFTSPR